MFPAGIFCSRNAWQAGAPGALLNSAKGSVGRTVGIHGGSSARRGALWALALRRAITNIMTQIERAEKIILFFIESPLERIFLNQVFVMANDLEHAVLYVGCTDHEV